ARPTLDALADAAGVIAGGLTGQLFIHAGENWDYRALGYRVLETAAVIGLSVGPMGLGGGVPAAGGWEGRGGGLGAGGARGGPTPDGRAEGRRGLAAGALREGLRRRLRQRLRRRHGRGHGHAGDAGPGAADRQGGRGRLGGDGRLLGQPG